MRPSVLAAGMNAEITLPSSVLRHYDVLVDFPGHKFSIGAPGTIQFRGPSGKVQINAENGLIQVPSQIENKKYNLALDLGSSHQFSFGGIVRQTRDRPSRLAAHDRRRGLGQHVGRWTKKRSGK